MKKNKYALVLSGGGFKGAFQAGAIKYMQENWQVITGETTPMKFDIVAGVSVGSLNGALVAMDKPDVMVDLWNRVGENIEEIYTSDFIDTKAKGDKLKVKVDMKKLKQKFLPEFDPELGFWEIVGAILSKEKQEKLIGQILGKMGEQVKKNLSGFKAIADNKPLHKLLTQYLDLQKIPDGTTFLCGSVSLTNGGYYCHVHTDFNDNREFVKAVLASTVMPIVWEPVESVTSKYDKATYLVDGGLRNVSPLSDVIDLIHADKEDASYRIFIINCNAGKVELRQHPEKMNIAEIALRSINDIALTEIFNNDLSDFVRINDLMKQTLEQNIDVDLKNYNYYKGERTDDSLKYFDSCIIQPDLSALGDTLVAHPALIEKRMKHGWEKAKGAFASVECQI
ncbi:MAG TPA: patatin-like phospholipase family protein [Cytophagales bacterium]|nr:patatin-like phospholipase family protein [Cytophagales bacterium]